VVARHSLNRMAEDFYDVARRVMKDANMDLRFHLCDA